MERPQYKLNKLNGRIVEMCGTRREFAKRMKIGEGTISKKLNNEAPFTQYEISRATEILEISLDEIGVYFFTK